MTNRQAKERLIQLYGAECFIDKLHLRVDDKPRHYKGKAQMKRMKQLTYHHIKEKSKGGKATVENGAILSAENHEWFNKQTPEKQAELNRKFQEYKKCAIQFTDDLDTGIEIRTIVFEPQEIFKEEKQKRKNRIEKNKQKQELQRLRKEYEDR